MPRNEIITRLRQLARDAPLFDPNGDGVLNQEDAAFLREQSSSLNPNDAQLIESNPERVREARAERLARVRGLIQEIGRDVNDDGSVDIFDANALLQMDETSDETGIPTAASQWFVNNLEAIQSGAPLGEIGPTVDVDGSSSGGSGGGSSGGSGSRSSSGIPLVGVVVAIVVAGLALATGGDE